MESVSLMEGEINLLVGLLKSSCGQFLTWLGVVGGKNSLEMEEMAIFFLLCVLETVFW